MHLLRTETVFLDEGASATDLGQTPADILFLSFSDSDLAGLASAWRADHPDMRAANIGQLQHHYSVDLYVEKMAPKARFVLVQVDDDGPGIPAASREDVFRPFYRLDEARNVDQGGSGLGLSIARDIARSHGGDVVLGDSPLGGLRASVRIPV